ncbi:hypothetical protein KQI46_05945 [Lysinibacillus capsici]|uniref:hypothetical protein n=1 Tax=Lysinibacillus capsici TaxID=2115968 RepID=UPI001C1004DC|nr:hypothetical protein [Lysinibacillus capsici]MBU5251475.1 hypothetical protein [Lysinibacillus capsici]
MDKHTMQILQDVSAHKEAIIQKVRQQIQQEPIMPKPRWAYRVVTMMITCSILLFIAWQAAKPMDELATQDEGVTPTFTDLFQTEVEGKDTAFSNFFPLANYLSQAKHIQYYAPLQGLEAMQSVATSLEDVVHLTDPENLPFQPNIQEVYALSAKMEDGSKQTQFQFSYKEKSSTGVDLQFINFTVTNVKYNPLASYVKSKNIEETLGMKVSNIGLNFMNPLFYREMSPERGYVYTYYNYDETDKRIFQMTTRANEFYSYYNGYVYHIGYQLEGDPQEVQEKMAILARDFILGE